MKSTPMKALRDKYLPAVIGLLLLVCSTVNAQVYQKLPNRYQYRAGWFDSTLRIPHGLVPKLNESILTNEPGALFYKTDDTTSLYVYTGYQFLKVGGADSSIYATRYWANATYLTKNTADLVYAALGHNHDDRYLQIIDTNSTIATRTWVLSQDFGGGSSQWTTYGTGIYYNTGNVVIGATADNGHKLRVVGAVQFNIGADSTGDMYYRDALGSLTRIPAPSASLTKPVLGYVSGVPAYRQEGGTSTPYTVTYSATPTFDYDNSKNQQITLTGNITTITLTDIPDGEILYILIKQDATGGRTIPTSAWPTGSKIVGGSLTLIETANAWDLVGIKKWGSNYLITYGKDFK